MMNMQARLNALEQNVSRSSIFPDCPRLTGALNERREQVHDYMAEIVTISRARKYPKFPRWVDRFVLESKFAEIQSKQPHYIHPEHPLPLEASHLQTMLEELCQRQGWELSTD